MSDDQRIGSLDFAAFVHDVAERLQRANFHREMTMHEWRVELQRELSRRKVELRERPANGRSGTRPDPHPSRSTP